MLPNILSQEIILIFIQLIDLNLQSIPLLLVIQNILELLQAIRIRFSQIGIFLDWFQSLKSLVQKLNRLLLIFNDFGLIKKLYGIKLSIIILVNQILNDILDFLNKSSLARLNFQILEVLQNFLDNNRN